MRNSGLKQSIIKKLISVLILVKEEPCLLMAEELYNQIIWPLIKRERDITDAIINFKPNKRKRC